MNFNYNLPVNLIFGRGRVREIGQKAAMFGKTALVVTGRSSAKKSGLLDRVLEYLNAAGVNAVVFDKVDQNPLTTTAYEGATFAKEHGCNVVIGLGGGSIMDAAKGIAFACVNDGDLSDYIFARRVSDEALPLILVPTTCGTGSEGNGFAVMTNPGTKDKKSLRCNAIIAKVSIIDPEFMTTMPKSVFASVGFDALTHCMEAFLSKNAQPMTDMMALEGIRLCGKYLSRAYDDYSDTDAWDNISWAATLGGMVIGVVGVTAPHSLEHPASGLRDIVHGRGLAALTPPIFEDTIPYAPEKFAFMSKLLGGEDENDFMDRLKRLLNSIDLELTLGDLGINEDDIDWMSENCLVIAAAGLSAHPVEYGLDDIKRLYKKSL